MQRSARSIRTKTLGSWLALIGALSTSRCLPTDAPEGTNDAGDASSDGSVVTDSATDVVMLDTTTLDTGDSHIDGTVVADASLDADSAVVVDSSGAGDGAVATDGTVDGDSTVAVDAPLDTYNTVDADSALGGDVASDTTSSTDADALVDADAMSDTVTDLNDGPIDVGTDADTETSIAPCTVGSACTTGGGNKCDATGACTVWPYGLGENVTGNLSVSAGALDLSAGFDLHVHAGQTVTIANGFAYDFNSITIDSGGILTIGPGANWTYIGIAGDLSLSGQFIASGNNSEFTSPTSVNLTLPDVTGKPLGPLLTIPYSFVQSQGGDGGSSGGAATPPTIGHGVHGNGGGGAGFDYSYNGSWIGATLCSGCNDGQDGQANAGGSGGASYTQSGVCTGTMATGGPVPGQPGQPGQPGTCGYDSGAFGGGGGGAGGARGSHGQPVYFQVKGSIYGIGQIIAAGTSGGIGGHGGNDFNNNLSKYPNSHVAPGGGGGGGAGGDGGVVVIRYQGSLGPTITSNITVSGGPGGQGGGAGSDPTGYTAAGPGKDGSKGSDGPTPDCQKYSGLSPSK